MQSLIDYARTFPKTAANLGEELGRFAAGQSPQVMFITCADSRVVPSLITGARPGELFELRTAGNIVPHYRPEQPSGEAATIEYAVEVLGVSDIIVCGHSHCGAVGAMVRGDDLTAVPAVRGWLALAKEESPDGIPALGPGAGSDIAEAVQSHVVAQLDRLRAYPGIDRQLTAGELRLHGWFYEVHTGAVLAHQPGNDTFLPL